ncbi:MAG: Asp-tRNA(Asn)/Glu-tRNA(Gln) amidotransferase subunit GatC [Nitrospinota bacterium]
MSNIDEVTVTGIANLARLNIEIDEIKMYAEQLSKILKYIDELNELETDSIEPTTHALNLLNVNRADKVDTESFDPKIWEMNAPDSNKDYFRVPRVIDE